MDKLTLTADKRTVTGKKVKQLRRNGIVPANVFGKDVKSLSIQLDEKRLEGVAQEAGGSSLIYLKVNDEQERPVLMQNTQRHPITGKIVHADFRQVDLNEKVTATVPLEEVGESPAVADKQALVLWVLDEIEVEALPTDLPEKIEVDVSGLTEIGQEILVKDVKIDTSKITVLTEVEETVLKLEPLVSEEQQKEMAEEEAKKAEEEAAAAATEGAEAPAEGAQEPQAPEEKQSEE